MQRLQELDKSVYVSTVSLTQNKVSFKCSQDFSVGGVPGKSYDDFVDWIWASGNQPIFMTTVNKEGEKWVDGGLKENVPITNAVIFAHEHHIKTIDVVVNNIEGANPALWPKPGKKDAIVAKLLKVIDVFSDEVRTSDIVAGLYEADLDKMEGDPITINLYYMPTDVFLYWPYANLFRPEKASGLWEKGFNYFTPKEELLTAPRKQTLHIKNVTIKWK